MPKAITSLILSINLFLASATTSFALDIDSELSKLSGEQLEVLKGNSLSDELKNYVGDTSNFVSLRLSDNDKEALKILGYSDDEISALSFDSDELDRLKNKSDKYLDQKSVEIEKGVTRDLIPGLTSAVIGLGFASMLGLVVGVRCRSMPSALAFAGTSAAWVGLEMSIWKGYQIEMDDIKTLQNAGKIPEKVEAEIARIKKLVKSLGDGFKVSGLDDFEAYLKTKESEINELKAIAVNLKDYLKNIKDKQFGALRSLQKSLELAAETSEKKARNAKIAAIGFGASAGVAVAEAFNVFGASGNCLTKTSSHFERVLGLFFATAHAAFANVADLDKIGIPVGAGLGAAYLLFEKKFADKIYASGTSRAVVFTSMAGLAYLASSKLKKSAEFLRKQAHEMDVFTTVVEDALKGKQVDFTSASELIDSLKQDLLPKVEALIDTAKEKIPSEEELKELAAGVKDDVKAKASEFEDTIKHELDLKASEIAAAITEAKEKVDVKFNTEDFSSKLNSTSMLNWLIPEAHANIPSALQIPRSCFRLSGGWPMMDESCGCGKTKSCARAYFPNNLQVRSNAQFGNEVVKTALALNRANNLILHRKADEGAAIYQQASQSVYKIEAANAQLLSQKLNSPYGAPQVAAVVVAALQSTKEALPGVFAKRGQSLTPYSAGDNRTNAMAQKFKQIKRENVRSKLRTHLKLAALLAQGAVGGSIAHASESDHGQREYNYSKNTIIEDTSKNLFEAIRLRYLKIYTSDRLHRETE